LLIEEILKCFIVNQFVPEIFKILKLTVFQPSHVFQNDIDTVVLKFPGDVQRSNSFAI